MGTAASRFPFAERRRSPDKARETRTKEGEPQTNSGPRGAPWSRLTANGPSDVGTDSKPKPQILVEPLSQEQPILSRVESPHPVHGNSACRLREEVGMPTIYITDRGDDQNDGLSLQTDLVGFQPPSNLMPLWLQCNKDGLVLSLIHI